MPKKSKFDEGFLEEMRKKYGPEIDNIELFKCSKAADIVEHMMEQFEYCVEQCPHNEICLKQIGSIILTHSEKKKKKEDDKK